MRFFLDTANLEELKAGARWGVVDGVTTNPTLIAKEGVPIEEQIRKICDIVNGDVSAEVVATEADKMLVEGRKLAKIHKNVVVKVPLTRDGIRACSIFSGEGIRVNVTLCFSAGQAILAVYNRNVFPELKVAWNTYPDNLGHEASPGCFRCHDGSHATRDRKTTITQDCEACHTVLAQGESNPEILKTLGLSGPIEALRGR